jgi:chromatin remodeling complex protein RSC6
MVTVFFSPRMLFRPPQVKKEITKATALARTQQTSAKKKKAKKATKKPAKKKAKKPKKKAKKKKKKKKKKAKKKKKKKKKKKVTKYPGGKRPKGVHKSKASKAAGKKIAAAQKKKGIGLFATKTLSADLAAICGKNKMARPEVVKSLWVYIKKNKLSKGRTITPDAKLKKVLPAASSDGCPIPSCTHRN